MTYKIKIVTFIFLALLLTGCAGHTDIADVSHTQGSVENEQTTYQAAAYQDPAEQDSIQVEPDANRKSTGQESVYHADFVYGSYIYEICDDADPYAVITGVTKAYSDSFGSTWLTVPDAVYAEWGMLPVKEVGSYAFAYLELESVEIPATVERIREGAFRGNKNLSEVLFRNASCEIDEDAFAGCGELLYVYYDEVSDENKNLVKDYAEENGFQAVENIPYAEIVGEPIVHYYEEPIHLTPRVEDFFYGEYADDENFLSMEYAEDATDFGWREWHVPCGEFCVGWVERNMTASSTLASSDDRYAVENLRRLTRNDTLYKGVAWAEGVDGPGIGEYITYDTRKSWIFRTVKDLWDMRNYARYFDRDESDYPTDSYGYPIDGYMRYLEVCVVNGYAKNEQTWNENGRVKTLLMYVENKPYAYLELEDTYKPQYIELPDEDILVVDGGNISFRFEIVDVYPGTKYEDTCLTGLELEFSGRFGH